MRILKPDPIKLGIPDPRIGVCISMAPIVGNYYFICRTEGDRVVMLDFATTEEPHTDDQILNSSVDILTGIEPSEDGLRYADFSDIIRIYNLCLI